MIDSFSYVRRSILVAVVLFFMSAAGCAAERPLAEVVDESYAFAAQQYDGMLKALEGDNRLPRTFDKGQLVLVGPQGLDQRVLSWLAVADRRADGRRQVEEGGSGLHCQGRVREDLWGYARPGIHALLQLRSGLSPHQRSGLSRGPAHWGQDPLHAVQSQGGDDPLVGWSSVDVPGHHRQHDEPGAPDVRLCRD